MRAADPHGRVKRLHGKATGSNLLQFNFQSAIPHRMRRGFTLVELSIVLVIIGLLIGGILVAQSMVSASKVAAQISQLQQFDAGVMSFKSSYKFLPGDSPAFGGNGNGLVAFTDSVNSADVYTCEIANFWNNIDQSKFTASSCLAPGVRAISTGASRNVPLSKLGASKAFLIASAITLNSAHADTSNPRNFYAILAASQIQSMTLGWYRLTTTSAVNSSTPPQELLALDRKTDDALANAGNILSGSVGNDGGTGIGAIVGTPAAGTCSSGSNYLITISAPHCTPLIRIGAQAGDLQ